MSKYTDEFMAFWKLYPPRWHEAGRRKPKGGVEHYYKSEKRLAQKEWNKLSDDDKVWAMYSARLLRKGKFVKDAFRWLRDGGYEDIDMPDEGERLPESMTNSIKSVPRHTININNERNRQMRELKNG